MLGRFLRTCISILLLIIVRYISHFFPVFSWHPPLQRFLDIFSHSQTADRLIKLQNIYGFIYIFTFLPV